MAEIPSWPPGGFPQPTTPPPTSLPVSNGYMGIAPIYADMIGRALNCYVGSGDNWSDPEGAHEPWFNRAEYCNTLGDGKVIGGNITDGVGHVPQGVVVSPALTLGYTGWIVIFNCWRLSTSPYPDGAYIWFELTFQDGDTLLKYASPHFDISGTNITNIPTTYTTSIDTSGVGTITTAVNEEVNLLKIDMAVAGYHGYFMLDYIAVTPDTPPLPTVTNDTYAVLDLNYHPRHLGS